MNYRKIKVPQLSKVFGKKHAVVLEAKEGDYLIFEHWSRKLVKREYYRYLLLIGNKIKVKQYAENHSISVNDLSDW